MYNFLWERLWKYLCKSNYERRKLPKRDFGNDMFMRTIANIKKDIETHLGEKVTLKANGGRKKNTCK